MTPPDPPPADAGGTIAPESLDLLLGGDGNTVLVTFKVMPNAVPPEVRLRRLLKIALRQLGLRATDVRPGGKVDGSATMEHRQ